MPSPEARRLDGRVAVVTGSASGIGRAACLLFAAHGAQVVALDCSPDGNRSLLEALRADGHRAEAHDVDLHDRPAVERLAGRLAARHPRIGVLFNNAGAFVPGGVDDTSPERWDAALELHLTAPFLLIRHLLDGLAAAGGAVVNNASIDGLHGHPGAVAYSTAKGGMIAMTRTLAWPLGRRGVRINCLATGGLETPMTAGIGLSPEVRAQVASATALGRWGTAQEAARVALFLASDDAAYVTGAVVPVDGGRTAVTPGIAGMLAG